MKTEANSGFSARILTYNKSMDMGYTRHIFRTTCLHTELPLYNDVNDEIFEKSSNTVNKCTGR